MIPRSTVAPANPRSRSRSTSASYSGFPWYLSRSPMWMRIRVRSPVKPCTKPSRWRPSEPASHRHELACRGEAEEGRGQGESDAEHDVQRGLAPLAVFGQRERLIAEGRKRG